METHVLKVEDTCKLALDHLGIDPIKMDHKLQVWRKLFDFGQAKV